MTSCAPSWYLELAVYHRWAKALMDPGQPRPISIALARIVGIIDGIATAAHLAPPISRIESQWMTNFRRSGTQWSSFSEFGYNSFKLAVKGWSSRPYVEMRITLEDPATFAP